MATFFRKIRKKLADDNKPKKYLRYAIGEILLVVIGILIALQINNWNEGRKHRAFETKMLYEVRSALISDINHFNMLIERIKQIESCAQKVIGYYDTNSVNTDSLITNVNCARMGILFNYNSGPLDAINSHGMDKITNDSLRKELINFYGFLMPRLKQLIEFGQDGSNSEEFEDFFKAIKILQADGTFKIKYLPKSNSLLHEPAFLRYIDDKQKAKKQARVRMNAALRYSNKLLLLLNNVLGINSEKVITEND